MKKILIIGMADSVHLANWIQNMRSLSVKVTLVSSSPHRRIHPKIVEIMDSSDQSGLMLSMPDWSRNFGFLLWILDRFLAERLRGLLVKRLIQELKPDLVHAIEFQHAGYILLQALAKPLPGKAPLIMTSNYGSDIYWFQRFPNHKKKISNLLKISDRYTSECKRDISLAEKLGFDGISDLIPNTGGISEKSIKDSPNHSKASSRKLILIKGYQNRFGQALQGVVSLYRLRKRLAYFEVVSISTNLLTAFALMLLKHMSGLRVAFHLKGALAHDEVLTLMSKARIYVGLSKSDGISTSLLEAMAMGAFPIQTGTSCASEWISDGTSGAIVSLGNGKKLDGWINRALSDDCLVDTAQSINGSEVFFRYRRALVASNVQKLYLRVFSHEVS